jgi:hypothetical protein
MLNQIFRKNVPPSLLFDLLELICLKTDKYYVIDMNAYKKLLFHELHIKLANDMIEYYHISKQFYATRKMTYTSFINIVRHICKNSNIMYTSQMRYNESKYNINYYVNYNNIPSIVVEYNEKGKPEIKQTLSLSQSKSSLLNDDKYNGDTSFNI